jgi:eukaryotic-like serine/threonine-protein kinase
MTTEMLIDVALLAHDRGYLDLPRLAKGMYELGRQPPGTNADYLVKAGFLTEEQLESLFLEAEDMASSLSSSALASALESAQAEPQEAPAAAPASGPAAQEDEPAEALVSGDFAVLSSRGGGSRGSEAVPSSTGEIEVSLSSFVGEPKPGPPPLPALPVPAHGLPAAEEPAPVARFTRVGLLGRGGMGDVHEFADAALSRRVAVKSLRADLSQRDMAAWMLQREAALTGTLAHPNIIPVYDTGVDAKRGPFYVMPVIKQPTLHDVLKRLSLGERKAAGVHTLGKLLRLFIQVCQAIDYAHTRGIVHCDLKPANILLGGFGEVIVVDWGFAMRMGEQSDLRGGTPGYMSPEQLEPGGGQIDGRADVFALGAILYEVLTLSLAFKTMTMDELVAAAGRGEPLFERPRPPREVAPQRAVPQELEDVCMRALELDPALRYQTAGDLARELEEFLEGTKEKERRLARAVELTGQGDALAEAHEELLGSRPDRLAEVAGLRASTAPWGNAEAKQPLWDAEDRGAVIESLVSRTFQAAVSAYEHALDELPSHGPARQGLAGLYWGERQRAQERRDDFNRVYFEGMVNQYDDGTFAELLGREGSLRIDCRPGLAEVALEHLAEVGRKLVTLRSEPLGTAPVALPSIAPGHYVATLMRPSAARVRYPFVVKQGESADLLIYLDGAADVAEGEVFVAGGPALVGGHESSLFGREPISVEVRPFIVAVLPVSFAEYLEFLAELFLADPARAEACQPCTGDGAPYWEWDGARLLPARITRWGHSLPGALALPVFGVDIRSAMAFAAWKSRKTGRTYRLPTEAEWEKAARGTDGRAFPWGDHFDASFCKMRTSRPVAAAPEASGVFEGDVSPYGVRDMAGGVGEWVAPSADRGSEPPPGGEIGSRGGAWCDWPADCAAAARRAYAAGERTARVGFRLVREVQERTHSVPPRAAPRPLSRRRPLPDGNSELSSPTGCSRW